MIGFKIYSLFIDYGKCDYWWQKNNYCTLKTALFLKAITISCTSQNNE